jgi:hypothetical protein
MGLLKAANSSALQWVDVEQMPYQSGYEPVMALAQNHIHFLDVPGVPAGSVSIYVIHCKSGPFPLRDRVVNMVASLQTTSSNLCHKPSQRPMVGRSLRLTVRPHHSSKLRGYAASLLYSIHPNRCTHFRRQVQETFAFVPDDGSATYVLNVETNQTQVLAGPSKKDAGATYFASITALVQLDSQGDVSYLLVSSNDTSANSAAKWNKVVSLANSAPATGVALDATNTANDTAKPTQTSKSSTGSSGSNGAGPVVAPGSLLGGLVSAAMLACAAVLF